MDRLLRHFDRFCYLSLGHAPEIDVCQNPSLNPRQLQPAQEIRIIEARMQIDKARRGRPEKGVISDTFSEKTRERVAEKMGTDQSVRDRIGTVQLWHQVPVLDMIRPVNSHGDQGRDLSRHQKHEYPYV